VPATAAMTEPAVVVLSRLPVAIEEMVKLVVDAVPKKPVPLAVSEAKVAPLVALNCEAMVVEPVVESVESVVAPVTASVLLALSAPPTVRSEETVVEPVMATVPVEVAPVVVNPPLKASWVEVAALGNGYVKGSVAVVR
jgi:hypothetical protein